jgi:phosphoribosylanthranilate isomerase
VIVKVCGVRTAEVVEVAIAAGADWIGVVFEPRSPRYADDRTARVVRDAVAGRADLVGVFVAPSVAECEQAVARHGLAAVQVHGDVSPEFAVACPVPVIRGINTASAHEAFTASWWPDCILLLDATPDDGGLPGGTGRRVPIGVAREVARHRRILLAGGISAETVAGAIDEVRPYGVDASSGLELAPGVKDPKRVHDYVAQARATFSALARGDG